MNTNSTTNQTASQSDAVKNFLDMYDVGSVIEGLGEMYRSYISDPEQRELFSDEMLQRNHSNNAYLVQEITLLILSLDGDYCRERRNAPNDEGNPIHLVTDVD